MSTKVTLEVEDAEELLRQLLPTGGHFQVAEPGDWLFRGQADANWKLVPKALRSGTPLPEPISWEWTPSYPENQSTSEQMDRELQALKAFFWRADQEGLLLPGDSHDLRMLLETHGEWVPSQRGIDVLGDWPPPALWSLMALAQHHGLPTRLLDWTRSGFVAAYFAATEAAEWCADPSKMPKGTTAPTHLSVWAWKRHGRDFYEDGEPEQGDVCVLSPPAATNRNLHAQKGVLLLHKPLGPVDLDKQATPRPLDEVLIEMGQEAEVKALSPPESPEVRLIEFRLFIAEAPRLLYELHRHGIDAASVFPGGDSVAKSLKERAWWRKRPLPAGTGAGAASKPSPQR